MIRAATEREIEAALAAADIPRAAARAEAALAAGEEAPVLLNLAAWGRSEADDHEAAHALLRRALALAPGDPLIRVGIGATLRRQGRLEEAAALLGAVAAEAPHAQAAWLEQGYALEALGRARAAAESYRRAARLAPACAPAFAGVATIAAREGDAAAARRAAGHALAIDPANAIARIALAALDIEAGEPARAAAALQALLARSPPPLDRIRALTLRGDALDRLGEADAAFAAYADANAVYAALHAPLMAGQPTHRAFVARLDAALAAADPARWTPLACAAVAETAATHAFLLGYPRSGTTLVENSLASLDGVTALEERPTLAEADAAFLLADDGMARLAALDADGATPFRAAYWRRVTAERGGAAMAGGALVDMDPLKSLRLPLIARLFPRARILFMRRDPRDVVWSCFRRNFRFSPANHAFTSLEGAALHYDATMRFAERCRATLPLAIHDVDYAALVADFDAMTRDACRFLDLRWSPAMRDFALTARRRGVTTSSATQVRGRLFDGGGQWRRYAAHLAPVLPILEPWIEKMGIAD